MFKHHALAHLNLITNTLDERMLTLHFTDEELETRDELRQNFNALVIMPPRLLGSVLEFLLHKILS